MAEKYSSPPHTDPPPQASRPGTAGVYTTPDTTQGAPKGTVGVFDRPERSPSSWSPLVMAIAAIIVVLLLLWFFGIFD